MTTVPPPTSNPLLQQVAATAAPVVMILQPPPAVAALPPGAILEGVVLPQSSNANSSNSNPKPDGTDNNSTDAPTDNRGDARASVTIRTAAGDVTVRLPTPLPAGSDVELQVVRAGPDQAAVRLVAVDDQPAAQVLAQLRQAANTAAPVPAQPQLTPMPAATTALPLANAWTPLGPVTLPALGPISAYVTQGTPPPSANVPLATGPLAAGPLAAGPLAVGTTPAAALAASPPVFTLLTGGDLALRVTAVELPTTPQSVAAPPPGAGPVPTPPVLNVPATSGAAPLTGAIPTSTPPSPAPSLSPAPVGATPLVQNAAATPSAAQPLNGNPLFTAPTSAPAVTTPTLGADNKPALVVAGPGGLEPPPPTPPSTPAAPPQATLTGMVIANDAKGTPIILTDLGQIQLNVRANLPVGTRITFDITAQEPPLPGSTPPSAPITSLPLSGPPLGLQAGGAAAGWPNLSEALTQLQKSDPAAAAQFAAAIPDGGPRSLVAMIAFAQAMRTGDTRRWPGDDNLRALERTGPRGAHLAAQIGDEVSALSTKARDTAGPEWRALPVPWNADGRIDRIALITRREGDPDSEAGKKSRGGGTRFLVNLDLSRLGPLQLDGMFRREARGFDLMIRTKETLPDDLRLELTGVFTNATRAVGLKGGLTFQVTRTFPDPTGGSVSLDKSGVWA